MILSTLLVKETVLWYIIYIYIYIYILKNKTFIIRSYISVSKEGLEETEI